jgi:hypothetical protein
MKIPFVLVVAALPVLLSSCATPPPPPQAYHSTDGSALVVESLNGNMNRILEPTASAPVTIDQMLTAARKLPRHQTAVVILENYTEPTIGDQFRDRGTPLFVGLRSVGYEHIYFLQGRGVNEPDGLITVAKYD